MVTQSQPPKQIKVKKVATDDLHDESLVGFPPNEEGANTTYPATPLGKKVVTAGREEGPDEG